MFSCFRKSHRKPTPDVLYRRTSTPPPPEKEAAACKLRVIHFNDVYELDNLPVLRSAIDALSDGLPRSNVVTTFAGDFLAPSLLSSIDQGRSMVAALNAVGVDVLCFGNHESDVPFEALLQRIEEFNGVWINSNMRTFNEELPAGECPPHHVLTLAPTAAGLPSRSVAFIGLLQGGGKDSSLYREGAFNGHAAKITPVLEAAAPAVADAKASHPTLDCILPLTHQVLADDIALAESGLGFPCILGGHDHDLIIHDTAHSTAHSTGREGTGLDTSRGKKVSITASPPPVLKAGEDAYNCIVVDLEWSAGAPPSPSPPTSLAHRVVRLAASANAKNGDASAPILHQPHAETHALVRRLKAPELELRTSVLAQFPPNALSSIGTRGGPSSMATQLASAMRESVQADVAVIHGGAVRGNKMYESGAITFGDLQTECPFPSPCIVAQIDGQTLSDTVQRSREPWRSGGINALALHVDDSVVVDPSTHSIVSIAGSALDPSRLYAVLIDSYLIRAELKPYCEAHPERLQPDDAGRPVVPILVEYFCSQMWRALVDTNEDGVVSASDIAQLVDEADANGDGGIDSTEVRLTRSNHCPMIL